MLRFGEFVFDSAARTLSRAGVPVPLTGKTFQLLEILVEHRPKVLTKARLLELVWPGTFVTEASLHSLVSELRAALDDTRGSAKVLRTVHGYGYAFCALVVEDEETARMIAACSILWGDRELPLHVGENVLGRDADVTVPIPAATVSRRHARIVVDRDKVVIEDLDSKNGTTVQGSAVDGGRVLRNGDEICLGSVRLRFHIHADSMPTSTMIGA